LKIARVFLHQNNMTPNDSDAYFGPPHLNTPVYDEVHISVVFTWHKEQAQGLAEQWRRHSKRVLIGGPAFNDPGEDFIPGRYMRQGITITSRGCPNNCAFCFVPKREGKIRELPIQAGNIIQDNNFLACSHSHRLKVYQMLKTQKAICFKGGLEALRLTVHEIEYMRGLRIREFWLACDTPNSLWPVINAFVRLRTAGFKNYQFRCYVIIGKDIKEETDRLQTLLDFGIKPFAQLYRADDPIQYSKEWKDLQCKWCRPAAMLAKKKPEARYV
jgi:hypothetical protein